MTIKIPVRYWMSVEHYLRSKPAVPPKSTPSVKVSPKDLLEGSTRMRLFRALWKHGGSKAGEGLAVREIQEMCGIDTDSGHLSSVIPQELTIGRILVSTSEREHGKIVKVYRLSAQGRKAFESGAIDRNSYAGRRIGMRWSKARRNAASS